MQYCLRHMEEPSVAECRMCHGTYCSRCLVFSFGPRKPPYCVGCALHASGVRPGTRRVVAPPVPEVESTTSFGSPVAFDDRGPSDQHGPPDQPSGGHRLSRTDRKARRHAEKEASQAARRGAEAAADALAAPSHTQQAPLDPVLSQSQLRLLSRLTAGRLADA